MMADKPHVLLVPDSPGWAFDNRCAALRRILDDKYSFELMYGNSMMDADYRNFDLIYYGGFFMVGSKLDKAFSQVGRRRICSTLSGMVSIKPERAAQLLENSAAFATTNPDFMSVGAMTTAKCFYIPNGVDVNLFHPEPFDEDREFTVGWAGNSTHRGKRLGFLRNICDQLKVRLLVADKQENRIPHKQMPGFYHQIDCYCCVSESEGSNNSVLEAAACGVPIITTMVGNAQEIVRGDGGFVIRNDLQNLGAAIIVMKQSKRAKMGKALRNRVLRYWTWEKRALQYSEMFDWVIAHRNGT